MPDYNCKLALTPVIRNNKRWGWPFMRILYVLVFTFCLLNICILARKKKPFEIVLSKQWMLQYRSDESSFSLLNKNLYWSQSFGFDAAKSAGRTLNVILFHNKQEELETECRSSVPKSLISFNTFRAKNQSTPVYAYRTTTFCYAKTPQRFDYRSKRLHEPEQRSRELDSMFCTLKGRYSCAWERCVCLEVCMYSVWVSFN